MNTQKRRKNRSKRKKKREVNKTKLEFLCQPDLTIELLIWELNQNRLFSEFRVEFVNSLENFCTRKNSLKSILQNLLQDLQKEELMSLNLNILEMRLASLNLHNFISKCVLWLILIECLKLGLFSELKIHSLIDICVNSQVSILKWPLKSTFNFFL